MRHTASCLLLGITALLSAADIALPDDAPEVSDDVVIAGQTLAAWRNVMKNMNTDDPASRQYVPGMMELMQRTNLPWFTRRQAALTLGRMGSAAGDAVPVLIRLLHEEDSESTKLFVLKAFMLLGPVAADAAPDLAALAKNPAEQHLIRTAALEALARIGPQRNEVLPLLIAGVQGELTAANDQAQNELRMTSADVLSLLGPAAAPAIPALIRTASADWPLLRLSAVTTIGQVGPQADIAIPTLADCVLFDDTDEVRDAAAKSLGKMGLASLRAFEQLAIDEDPAVRERAVIGLEVLGKPGHDLLAAFLNEERADLRIRSARTLLSTQAHRKTALKTLLSDLQKGESRTRRRAYEALRDLRAQWDQTDPQFLDLLQSDDTQVRSLAERLQQN